MIFKERELRNTILLNLGDLKISQNQQGQIVGLTQQSVSKIHKKVSLGLPITQKRFGAKARLSAEQLVKLPEYLIKRIRILRVYR
jgi:hypothetical protein